MTQEQKEQLAREYANNRKYTLDELNNSILTFGEIVRLAHIAGANSRDEEVERLENENAELSEQLKMNAENIQKLRAELKKAQNPWVSAEERLPEEGKCVFVRTVVGSYSVGQYIYPQWYIAGIPSANGLVSVTHWMPIPKGGDK